MKRGQSLAYAAFAVVCIVWGTTYLAIRIALETVPPLLLTGIRFTFAGLIILALASMRGERIPRDRRVLLDLALVGLLMVAVANLAVVWAEQWIPSGMAALLVATAPFWMAIIESMRPGGERAGVRGAAGMIIGFIGVALLVSPTAHVIDRHLIVGALVLQLGSIGWQLGSVRSKYSLAGVPALMSASLQMLFGGLVVGVLSLANGDLQRTAFSLRSTAAVVYLTLFGSVLAYSAYVYALSRIRTTKMSLYAYVNPVIAVCAGWLVLGERLTLRSFVAMAIILSAVAMVQSASFRRRRPAETASGDLQNAA